MAREIRVQLAMSVVTLLVTPILSVAVVTYQLSREHSFVQGQHDADLARQRTAEKVRIQEDISRTLGDLAAAKISLDIDQSVAKSVALFPAEIGKVSREPGQAYLLLRASAQEHMRLLGILQSQLQSAYHAFGPAVDQAIDTFAAAGYMTGATPTADAADKTDLGKTLESVLEDLQSNRGFDQAQEFVNAASPILSAMSAEIQHDLASRRSEE